MAAGTAAIIAAIIGAISTGVSGGVGAKGARLQGEAMEEQEAKAEKERDRSFKMQKRDRLTGNLESLYQKRQQAGAIGRQKVFKPSRSFASDSANVLKQLSSQRLPQSQVQQMPGGFNNG